MEISIFNPKTERVKELSIKYPDRIHELESILDKKTNVYIDYANVKPWANKLAWHIEPKRLKQLLSDGKKVILFATARRVSSELSELVSDGLFIFDIQKIRNFICWKKEIKPD